MSYAGMYDPAPIPEPKKKPQMKVVLTCGAEVFVTPWWMSDPLYGGWRRPDRAWCPVHQEMGSIKGETWPPEHLYAKGDSR